MSLWTSCQGRSHIQSLEAIAWRVVETQEKSYTRKLVSSSEELDILESLIENSKPKIDPKISERYHYLLFSPFRYPPLKHGSRFGRIFEPALWYGALKIETALREVAYYRLLFLNDSKAELKLNIPLSAYSVKARSSKALDLTTPAFDAFREQISSALSYEHSQALGTEMRENEVELFLYYSARTLSLEKNLGVFYPQVFHPKKPLKEPLSLSCYADRTVVEFRAAGQKKTILCPIEEFQEQGPLDYPKNRVAAYA